MPQFEHFEQLAAWGLGMMSFAESVFEHGASEGRGAGWHGRSSRVQISYLRTPPAHLLEIPKEIGISHTPGAQCCRRKCANLLSAV
jgi:hypothetical protein